jgi:two-component sensor histidine kinase
MDEYMSRRQVWSLVCPGLPEEVGRVRRWTRDILGDSACADDAALIATELGSNALLHTASGGNSGVLSVMFSVDDLFVSISVLDSGGTKTEPQTEHPSDDDTHGRGLQLVTALALNVEVHGDNKGHTVTAHLLRNAKAS